MGEELVKVPLAHDATAAILDSATGDGLWMKEVAAEFPRATLLGTDIVQRGFSQIPNMPAAMRFKLQAVLEDRPTEDQRAFDLVHQRVALASFRPELGEAATRRLFGLVRPGGYIPLVDGDLLGFEGGATHPAMAEMMRFMERAFAQGGMNPVPGRSLKAWLEAAGSADLIERVYQFGLGRQAESDERNK